MFDLVVGFLWLVILISWCISRLYGILCFVWLWFMSNDHACLKKIFKLEIVGCGG